MKLFFKHLIRSIKKRPLQPFILTFTLTLALIVCTLSVMLGGYLLDEVDFEQSARYGKADIEVSINSQTENRFMFTKTVKEVLGDKVQVAGCYDLPVFLNGKNGAVSGVAVDFNEIGDIFALQFSSYGEVLDSEVDDTVFISKEFKESQN